MIWIEQSGQRSWDWHFKRIQISFSKGKHRKVEKLAKLNGVLQEMLGYGERIIPLFEARKSSPSVALLEKIRQHACNVHALLKKNWKCAVSHCQTHNATLNLVAETEAVKVHILFVLDHEDASKSNTTKQEVMVEAIDTKEANLKPARMKMALAQQPTNSGQKQPQGSASRRFKSFLPGLGIGDKSKQNENCSNGSITFTPGIAGRQTRVSFQLSHDTRQGTTMTTTAVASSSTGWTGNLCQSLRTCQDSVLGVLVDEHDRGFRLARPSQPRSVKAPDTAELVPMPDLLNAHYRGVIELSRQCRFQMASHIASGLLYAPKSPWLQLEWSKKDFFFLADDQSLFCESPFVSSQPAFGKWGHANPITSAVTEPVSEEEFAQQALFKVGVIILELIFGCNIEQCSLREEYLGEGKQPNDQTDICTARKWSRKVLGECGPEISDAVRRCLNCSFGPKPCMLDKQFREAIYEGVIKPLAQYSLCWQPVM